MDFDTSGWYYVNGDFSRELLAEGEGSNGPFFFSDSFLSLSGPHLLNKRREAL
jgi:hypothetical protein